MSMQEIHVRLTKARDAEWEKIVTQYEIKIGYIASALKEEAIDSLKLSEILSIVQTPLDKI